MKAKHICQNLNKAIVSGTITSGAVHSVFHNACNIFAGGDLVTLISGRKPIQPMSILVEEPGQEVVDFHILGIKPGMTFLFNRQDISCIEMQLRISLDGADHFSPGIELPGPKVTKPDFTDNLNMLIERIAAAGNPEGALQLKPVLESVFSEYPLPEQKKHVTDGHFQFIEKRTVRLIDTLIEGESDAVSKAAGQIIGFGTGLTPAMDDFLCGIMISLGYMEQYIGITAGRTTVINKRMIEGNLHRTTEISAAMLRNAARGMAGQAVKELMRALLCQNDKQAITDALKDVLDIGGTSGTDMATGIYTGCRIAMLWDQKRSICHACNG